MTLEMLLEFMHSCTKYQIFSYKQWKSHDFGPWMEDYEIIESGLMDHEVVCAKPYDYAKLRVMLTGDDVEHE